VERCPHRRPILSIPHLRTYLQRLDDFADVEAEERALQSAEAHSKPLLALDFWPYGQPCLEPRVT
jgi:hypothetical protein